MKQKIYYDPDISRKNSYIQSIKEYDKYGKDVLNNTNSLQSNEETK